MEIWKIILVIIIVVLLYFTIKYLFTDKNTLSAVVSSATTMQTISSTDLSSMSNGASSTNFTYSIWIYINNWDYKYNENKYILCRSDDLSTSTSNIKSADPCPAIYLDPLTNNLIITMTSYQTKALSIANTIHTDCTVPNIPIQSWTNILVSVYNTTLDVYLDGKLVKTQILDGPAKVNANDNLYITPLGGFDGWTAKCQYFPNYTDPQTAWNIYRKGYGASLLGGLSQYQFTLNLVKNGQTVDSYTV
jgi:hypothetical protein